MAKDGLSEPLKAKTPPLATEIEAEGLSEPLAPPLPIWNVPLLMATLLVEFALPVRRNMPLLTVAAPA